MKPREGLVPAHCALDIQYTAITDVNSHGVLLRALKEEKGQMLGL
jgi:hypothetical protein